MGKAKGDGLSSWKKTNLGISSVQSLSHVRLFVTPWTVARQASLSITNSWSLHKLMSIESVMPSNHLILCRPLLLLPSIFPSIRDFSNESALSIRPNYLSFSFNIHTVKGFGIVNKAEINVFFKVNFQNKENYKISSITVGLPWFFRW